MTPSTDPGRRSGHDQRICTIAGMVIDEGQIRGAARYDQGC
ncbi:hypothetical protein ABZ357_24045 [Streptomyces sp. NPDC005917]